MSLTLFHSSHSGFDRALALFRARFRGFGLGGLSVGDVRHVASVSWSGVSSTLGVTWPGYLACVSLHLGFTWPPPGSWPPPGAWPPPGKGYGPG